MEKSLERKLQRLQADSTCDEFILADAKDADMAFGLAATGVCPISGRPRTLPEYRQQIRLVVEQSLIDISLMSASTAEALVAGEGAFENSTVTPAVRMNDSTDIWLAAGTGNYASEPSLPFRSASLEHVVSSTGKGTGDSVRLGLYSMTLNNQALVDRATLEAFTSFRQGAEAKGFEYFLEVFPPNVRLEMTPNEVGRFISDSIVRILAGLTRSERPLFLKIPYLGPALTERLAAYDPTVILGIMGGASGTTYDAFALLANAKKHGVRAALFGRRINNAEDQLAFVQHLRWIADGEINPEDAVHSYHEVLQQQGLMPQRALKQDLELSPNSSASYSS